MKPTSYLQRWSLACLLMLAFFATVGVAQTSEQVWGYKVKPGDRLVDIAKAYQKSPEDWKKLQEKNAVADPKRLIPGKQLNIAVPDLRQGDPTAEAVLVHGDVHRLDKTGQLPVKLSSGDILKMGDTVQTGARSTVTIRFADDSRMLVTEKSKVNLASLVNYGKTGMADTKVRVLEGGADSQVSPQRGPVAKYEINTPAVNLAVRGTGFRVQVEGTSGSTRTEVVEGRVQGNSGASEASISEGFGLIAEPGQPLGTPRKLLPMPQLQASPNIVGKLPVKFAWSALEGAQKYRLQLLAKVQDYEALLVEELVENTSVQWNDLPDGDYSIRVRGVDASGLEGANAVKAFQLTTRPEPPALSFPPDNYRSTDSKVSFRWESAPEAEKFVFQLAQDADFARLVAVVPQISKATTGVLLTLPAGAYFWRVASIGANGKVGPFGDARAFLITAQ